LSKLYQHFRERDLPYGLQNSLCTLTSHLVRSYLLRSEINTRYGREATPYPAGTFTLQDTPGFARRDNVTRKLTASCASKMDQNSYKFDAQ